MSHPDRRRAQRYRVPARARLWWEGGAGVSATVGNVSATGCRFEGEVMPRQGETVWLSLTMPGLPDLRLPAQSVRESKGPDGMPRAAVHFKIPTDRVSGLELLLLQRLCEQQGRGVVLVVERDPSAREQLLQMVRQRDELCIGVAGAEQATRIWGTLNVSTVLTGADRQALEGLLSVSSHLPNARRVVMGSSDAAQVMLARGQVDLLLTDTLEGPGLRKTLPTLRRRGRAQGSPRGGKS